MIWGNKDLKSPKYRESLARLKKSKILIICLENPFREMYSKNFSKFEKSNVSEEMGKNENLGFYEIGGVFTSKYNSFDLYLWHFKELWFNFKIHMIF